MSRRRPANDDARSAVWSFVRQRSTPAVDARASFELVGTRAGVALDADADPLRAMRAWLRQPANGTRIDPALHASLDRAMELATRHWREADALAARLAGDVDATPAPADLARLDAMTTAIARFSIGMRELVDAPDAAARLERALASADAQSGALPALVAAL